MKRILSGVETKFKSNKLDIKTKPHKDATSSFKLKNNIEEEDDLDTMINNDKKRANGSHNKLSYESITFKDEERYGKYPDDTFQPSVYFWKFLVVRPDYEKENRRKYKKLNLYIPDTLVFNESDVNFWIYTDVSGRVCRTDYFSDSDIIEKFKSHSNDSNKEVLAVFKTPIYSGDLLESNHLEVLNQDDLEKHLFSKSSSPSVIQKYIKCRGPKAFICRSVYRKSKNPFVYIFTNKAGYSDFVMNQSLKFVINSKETESYYIFYSTSGKHLEETSYYMNNIVKFIESHTDVLIEELACDFVKDEAGTWWMINCKAMKIKNLSKFKNPENNSLILQPNLSKFASRIQRYDNEDDKKKFDYQTKLKCKFCGISYNKVNLKYSLTTKMILETDKQLRHLNINLNYIDRPDLSHTDSSMVYLSYRVCEDCYLMFETMNDIKHYQIKIANFFRVNVDPVNFGVEYYMKDSTKSNIGVNSNLENQYSALLKIPESELKTMRSESKMPTGNLNSINNDKISSIESASKNNINNANTISTNNHVTFKLSSTSPVEKDISGSTNNDKNKSEENKLYRIIIIFSDIFWNPEVVVPEKELYLIFNFLGTQYKARIKAYYPELDYLNVNFFKMFYVACNPNDGFIEYIDKNRTMLVKIGYFEESVEAEVKNSTKVEHQISNNNIIIEDKDICSAADLENFIQFSSVELSIQGLKYGEKYRNSLNGLLFKEQKPYYTGKLRCTIRINQEKTIDVNKFNFKKHYNLFIPPVHFVTPEELPDYWLEIIERQKLRESILNKIMMVMSKENIDYNKEKNKEEIFMTLESLISHYLSNKK